MVFLKGVARQSRTMIVLPVLVVVKVHRPVDVAKLYCNRRRKSQTQKYRYTFRSFCGGGADSIYHTVSALRIIKIVI